MGGMVSVYSKIGRLFVPQVCEDGYLYAGNCKLFRVCPERGTVQFIDRDQRRADRRGSPYVEIKINQLCEVLHVEVAEPEIFYDSGNGGEG